MKAVGLSLAYVLILASGTALGAPCNVSGAWICNGNCLRPGGIAHAQQTGNTIRFFPEKVRGTDATNGYWKDDNTIVNNIKGTMISGKVNGTCSRIDWSDRTYWIRSK
jgi:hypothetical protein